MNRVLGSPTATYPGHAYDCFGNQISQSLPDPANGKQDSGSPTTTYTYDADGDMLSLTDPDQNTTTWTYDALGDETSQSEVVSLGYVPGTNTLQTPVTATSTYQYDLDGNLAQSTDADGRTIDYSYNSMNQETGENWYDQSGNLTGTESFSYDVEGNMLSAANYVVSGGTSQPVSQNSYWYSATGNVTTENVQLGDLDTSHNVVLSSGYDYNNNLTSLSANIGGAVYNSGGSVWVYGGTADFSNTYQYDALGNMTYIAQSGGCDDTGTNVTLTYDADSRLIGATMCQVEGDMGNEVAASTYTYDHDSRLTDLTYTDGATPAKILAAYHWDYDNDSRVIDEYSWKDTTPTPALNSSYTAWAETQYNYDADGQLSNTTSNDVTTDAVRYSANFANAPTTGTSENYDLNGNNTDNGAPGAGNRLLSDGTYDFTYDADGNRIAETNIKTGVVTAYAWNNASEMTGVSGGGVNAMYAYDAFGRMVTETDNGTTQNFVYDGQSLVLVLNANGQVVERELNGAASPLPPGEGQGEGVLASEAGPASTAQPVGTVNWDLTDNQGTVRDVVQYANGVTTNVDHLVYDSCGQIAWQLSAADQPRATYAGMPFDSASGMYDDGARKYAATDAVFASLDPLGFGGGQTNLSEYCGNSPTNATDPSGEQARQGVGQAAQDGNQPAQNGGQTQSPLFSPSDYYSQAAQKAGQLENAVSDRLQNMWDQLQKESSDLNNQLLQSSNMTSALQGMMHYLDSAVGFLTSFGSSGGDDLIPVAPTPPENARDEWEPGNDLAFQRSAMHLNLSSIVNPSSTIISPEMKNVFGHFGHLPLSGLNSRVGFNVNFQFTPFYPVNLNTTIWIGTNPPTTQLIGGRPEVNLTPTLSPAFGLGIIW